MYTTIEFDFFFIKYFDIKSAQIVSEFRLRFGPSFSIYVLILNLMGLSKFLLFLRSCNSNNNGFDWHRSSWLGVFAMNWIYKCSRLPNPNITQFCPEAVWKQTDIDRMLIGKLNIWFMIVITFWIFFAFDFNCLSPFIFI